MEISGNRNGSTLSPVRSELESQETVLSSVIRGLRKGESRVHVLHVEQHVREPQQKCCNAGSSCHLGDIAEQDLHQADVFHGVSSEAAILNDRADGWRF